MTICGYVLPRHNVQCARCIIQRALNHLLIRSCPRRAHRRLVSWPGSLQQCVIRAISSVVRMDRTPARCAKVVSCGRSHKQGTQMICGKYHVRHVAEQGEWQHGISSGMGCVSDSCLQCSSQRVGLPEACVCGIVGEHGVSDRLFGLDPAARLVPDVVSCCEPCF